LLADSCLIYFYLREHLKFLVYEVQINNEDYATSTVLFEIICNRTRDL